MPEFRDYTSESHEMIGCIFGAERAQDIVDENRADAAGTITGERLREKWQEILQQISNLPDVGTIKGLYDKLDAKSCLQDIGVANDQKDFLLKYAPLVRNRLTLLRLLSRGVIYSASDRS